MAEDERRAPSAAVRGGAPQATHSGARSEAKPSGVDRMNFGTRPWWMNGLFLFCLFMTFAYMPYDMFWKPVESDQEVWFGFLLHGWAAKATEPLHWAIYGAGAYGFWKMRHWLHPWAALYTAQVAIGMLVWALTDSRVGAGRGLAFGIPPFLAFAGLAWLLWRSRGHFGSRAG